MSVDRNQFVAKAMALPEDTQARLFAFLVLLVNGNDRAERFWRMVEDGQIVTVEQLVAMFRTNRAPLVVIGGGKP